MAIPARVEIVEVGPRDGLQNESAILDPETKVALIELLAQAGLRRIEAGSFVSETAVPQMAATAEVLSRLCARNAPRFSVLVPNLKGLRAARAAGAKEIAVFAAASESFSQRNINCSIRESLDRYAGVVADATRHGLRARGYVSCALGCPYEGAIDREKVVAVARDLCAMGCEEISLADTIGVGTPLQARALVECAAREIGLEKIAIHFHDTYGQALANIFACIETGVSVIDASVAGLGGCPYAPGATGNVATEDVLYMLDGMGVETGVDLELLLKASAFISQRLGKSPKSGAARAFLCKLQPRNRTP